MAEARETKITELKPDQHNANRGTQRGLRALDDSLRTMGAGRSILLDKHGSIIAGNKTAERAADIGLDDVLIVQTDGTRLVAVQRTDLDLETDPKARQLAYADNRVGELDLDWEPAVVLADIDAGINLDSFFDAQAIEEFRDGDIFERGNRAGASPWERMGADGADGVLFTFGEVCCRLPDSIYELFLISCPKDHGDIVAYLSEALS